MDRVLGYDFHINWIEGKLNYVADAMSRVEEEETEFPDVPNAVPMLRSMKRVNQGGIKWRSSRDLEEMATEAREDSEYQLIMDKILKGTKKEDIMPKTDAEGNVIPHILQDYKPVVDLLKIVDVGEDRLLYKDNKLVPPECARKNLIVSSHQGHLGAHTIYSNLNELLWWPRMRQAVLNEAEKCKQCAEICKTKRNTEPIIPVELQQWSPGELWSLDLFSKWG